MFGSRNFLFAKGGVPPYIFPAIPAGTFFTWGKNNSGQNMQGVYSLGGYPHKSSPTQVGALATWALPSAGPNHAMCTKTDGTLWGAGGAGGLGQNNTISQSSPVQVGSLTDWARVSAGGDFTSCVKTDGTLWTWGQNGSGRLGLGNTTNYSSPVQVGSLKTWKTPAAGQQAMLCLKQDGTLWTWGNNSNGQLGLNNTTSYSSPKQIGSLTTWKKPSSSTNNGGCALCTREDGTLWAWGKNTVGQLGLGDKIYRSSPTQVGSLTNWLTPISNAYFSLCVKTDGTLWSWGQGSYRALGLGNTTSYSSPKQIGSSTNWAKPGHIGNYSGACVTTNGKLYAWGYNGTGQLGLNNTTNQLTPVQVGALTTWGYLGSSGRATAFCTQLV